MDGCTATVTDKKLSYRRGTTCSAKSVEILQTGAHNCTENSLWKDLQLVNDTEGHWNCRYLIGHLSLSISGLQ